MTVETSRLPDQRQDAVGGGEREQGVDIRVSHSLRYEAQGQLRRELRLEAAAPPLLVLAQRHRPQIIGTVDKGGIHFTDGMHWKRIGCQRFDDHIRK